MCRSNFVPSTANHWLIKQRHHCHYRKFTKPPSSSPSSLPLLEQSQSQSWSQLPCFLCAAQSIIPMCVKVVVETLKNSPRIGTDLRPMNRLQMRKRTNPSPDPSPMGMASPKLPKHPWHLLFPPCSRVIQLCHNKSRYFYHPATIPIPIPIAATIPIPIVISKQCLTSINAILESASTVESRNCEILLNVILSTIRENERMTQAQCLCLIRLLLHRFP